MKKVLIVGSGPAGLMAAYQLAKNGYLVEVYDQKKSLSRKLLVAGKGGFNLTHSEEISSFAEKVNDEKVKQALYNFTNEDFRALLDDLDIPTYVGSSGRVFPEKGIKPATVVSKWRDIILKHEGRFFVEHKLMGIDGLTLKFASPSGEKNVSGDYILLALGGGSWAKTGSDGHWVQLLKSKGVKINPFLSSNSGFVLDPTCFDPLWKGKALKNCAVFSKEQYRKGDLVWTDYGLEGTPVYALNVSFRNKLDVFIDFKPDLSEAKLSEKWNVKRSPTDQLRDINCSKEVIAFIKKGLSREDFLDSEKLQQAIKKFRLKVTELRPVDEVISTVGGVAMTEVDQDFQSKRLNNVFFIGEMLDWDTCTGGYLIQSCVSMGYSAARSILKADRSLED